MSRSLCFGFGEPCSTRTQALTIIILCSVQFNATHRFSHHLSHLWLFSIWIVVQNEIFMSYSTTPTKDIVITKIAYIEWVYVQCTPNKTNEKQHHHHHHQHRHDCFWVFPVEIKRALVWVCVWMYGTYSNGADGRYCSCCSLCLYINILQSFHQRW